MLMDISSEMIHSLLPMFMVGTLGISVFVVGVIDGIAESTTLLVKVFSGALSDRLGKRKMLAVFGYGISAFSKPLFALSQGMGLLLTARLLDRAGKGIRGAPRDALITDITPAEIRGQAFGLRQSLDTIGAVAGPLLATALMLLWAKRFPPYFLACSDTGPGCNVAAVCRRARAGYQATNQPWQSTQQAQSETHGAGILVGGFSRMFVYARPIQRSISDFTGTTIIRSCRAGATCDGRHEPRLCGDSLSIW